MAKRKKSDPIPPSAPEAPAPVLTSYAGVLTIAAALCVGLVAVGAFLPDARLWGVNHLAFYPIWLRIVALGVVASMFAPPVARRAYCLMVWPVDRLRGRSRRVPAAIVALSLLSGATFWVARSSTNLLGDGQLIAQSFDAAQAGNKTVVMRNVRSIIREEPISAGATLLYYGSGKWAAMFDKPWTLGLRIFNCVLGALFVFLLLRLLRRVPISRDLALWLAVACFFGGAMELFFGYVENYTPLVFGLSIYVAGAFLAIQGRLSVWWVLAALVATIYTHIQAAVFLPSFAYLVLWRMSRARMRWIGTHAAAIALLVLVIGVAAGRVYFRSRFFLPVLGNGETYGILSPLHFADMANELMLLLPALPFFATMAWAGWRYRKALPEPIANARLRDDSGRVWLSQAVEWNVASVMLASCLCYFLLFNPEIGMARDWDLFAMFALALIPWTLLVFNRYLRLGEVDGATIARVFAPMVALVVVTGVAWLGINASPWRSADRFERILNYEEAHASYAMENLAIFYHDKGRMEKATQLMEKTAVTYGNPRHYLRLAMYYEEVGRADDGVSLLFKVLESHPDFDRGRFKLCVMLENTNRWDEMLPVSREGTVRYPNEAIYHFYYGESLRRNNDIPAALDELRKCRALNPPPAVSKHIDELLQRYGQTP